MVCQEREQALFILLSVTLTDCHREAAETPGRQGRKRWKTSRAAFQQFRQEKPKPPFVICCDFFCFCVHKILENFHNQESSTQPFSLILSFTHSASFSTLKVFNLIICKATALHYLFSLSLNNSYCLVAASCVLSGKNYRNLTPIWTAMKIWFVWKRLQYITKKVLMLPVSTSGKTKQEPQGASDL